MSNTKEKISSEKLQNIILAFKSALQNIVYVTQLHDAVKNKKIGPQHFKDKLHDPIGIDIDTVRWSQKSFEETTLNIKTITYNYAIIYCKESYSQDLWIEDEDKDKEEFRDLYEAQMILKFMRDAMAHLELKDGAIQPIWWITKKKNKRLFEVKAIGVKLDAINLHDNPFNYSYLGGYQGFFKLIKYFLDNLEDLSKKSSKG